MVVVCVLVSVIGYGCLVLVISCVWGLLGVSIYCVVVFLVLGC